MRLEDTVLRNTFANRPAPEIPGRLFYDTTNSILYRDSGSLWESIEGTGGGGPVVTTPYVLPAVYRAGIVVADLLPAPTQPTATLVTGAGSLEDAEHWISVKAVNEHGASAATGADTTVTTATPNSAIRVAIAQAPGATHYDVFCGANSDPNLCCRITEAQRAAGCANNDYFEVIPGSVPGCIDIYLAGDGAAASTFAGNAWYVEETIDCTGYDYADFDVLVNLPLGYAGTPSLTLLPLFGNSVAGRTFMGQPITLAFDGEAIQGSFAQRIRVDVRASDSVALAVAVLSIEIATVDIYAVLS
jgi:hypothetical protein